MQDPRPAMTTTHPLQRRQAFRQLFPATKATTIVWHLSTVTRAAQAHHRMDQLISGKP